MARKPSNYPCLNLDAMSRGELSALLDSGTLHPIQAKCAGSLFVAKGLRIKGEIANAMRVEADADRFYNQLPASLRW